MTVSKLAELEFAGLNGRTIVLPPAAGGLSEAKMLDGKAGYSAEREYDVADHPLGDEEISRFRIIESINEDGVSSPEPVIGELPDKDARERFEPVAEIDVEFNDSGEPSRRFVAWVAAGALEGEQSRSKYARFEQYLCDHLRQAERYATALAERLLPEGPERLAVRLAAKWHDLGKDRDIWQAGVGNRRPRDGTNWQPLAKSGKVGRILGLDGYRHEFGSLLDAAHCPELAPEFTELTPEAQALVLHLIAAHHGRGRPHFPSDPSLDETFEPTPNGRDVLGMAAAVPQRYARLQRKYGRWGLAYLESLVRAADILASQRAEGGAS
jgi:CRISPR-associated endonuclease/helicase Cas3